MHSKTKGNIAEAAVALALSKMGCNVFRELGDLSKIDLIAEFNRKIVTFQVKGVTPKNGVVVLNLIKSGHNYISAYEMGQFDFFAVCNLTTMEIAWVPSKILLSNKFVMFLRCEKTKNKQITKTHMFSDFNDLLSYL